MVLHIINDNSYETADAHLNGMNETKYAFDDILGTGGQNGGTPDTAPHLSGW